jgi:hypothetical protein
MNKLITLLIFSVLSISVFSQGKNIMQLKELQAIKVIDKKEKDRVFKTFIKVNKSLRKEMDDSILKELARVYTLLHEVDSNYYIVEPFSDLIKVKNSPFKARMKEFLPKEDYKIFEENIDSLLSEMKNGNG